MRAAADINAVTSYDDTVYELTVPNDDDIVETGLDILEDWLSFALIDPDDVEGIDRYVEVGATQAEPSRTDQRRGVLLPQADERRDPDGRRAR